MRLNKFLSGAGVASRRKADELIKSGVVCVNGKQITEMGFEINEKNDKVTVNEKSVTLSSFVYYKMNKPKGYICSNSDEKGRKTVFELIKTSDKLFTVGRLDYNTEGLILVTNDGDFANHVAHPRMNIEKEYKVSVEGEMQESEFAVLRNGVVIGGERLPKARVKFLSCENKVTKLSVVIDEGMNRQIRRMFEGINRTIILLKRVRIGSIKLGGLSRGEYKALTEEEIIGLVGEKW